MFTRVEWPGCNSAPAGGGNTGMANSGHPHSDPIVEHLHGARFHTALSHIYCVVGKTVDIWFGKFSYYLCEQL